MTEQSVSERYPSFDSMRAVHSQLIKQFSLDSVSDTEIDLQPVLDFLSRGQATGALLDADSERESAQTMLDYWSTRLYTMSKTSMDSLLDDFDPSLAPELPDSLSPYRGLNAFNEEDAAIFFGRQKTIEEMITRIAQERFLAVVGPSGSGKSSIVRAGLLPELNRGAVQDSQNWVFIPIFVPSSRPLANLIVALNRASQGESDSTDESPEQGESLTISDEETAEYVNNSNRLLEQVQERFDSDVVITVDQFEEIFTLCDNESIRRAFVENLLNLVRQAGSSHRVVVTMRVDFEPKLALYPDLQQIFEANVIRLTPLTAADLRQAIEEPARRIGLKFEEGLIDTLLNDILGEPAALPLLQFTLLKLWEHRDRNRITWENYRHLGGGRQALANSADEFYSDLIPEDQVTARRILLRLVRPGEGMEVTSQRMRRLDLYTRSDAADRIDRVLEKFIDARLLRLTRGPTPYDDQIEVAHEALVRNWPTLVSWLEDEREAIRQRRRLTVAAERWNEMGCSPDLLLRGVELEEALRYDDVNPLESSFLQASQQARADEIEQAKQVANELRRRNRIITAASIVAGIVAIIAIAMGLLAVNRSQAAEQAKDTAEIAKNAAQTGVVVAEIEKLNADFQRVKAQTAEAQAQLEKSTAQAANTQIVAQQATEKALSTEKAAQQTTVARVEQVAMEQNIVARIRQLAEQARSLVSRQTDLGVLLGLESADLGDTLAEKGVLLDVMRANPNLIRYLHGHTGPVNDVAYRPDGKMIASAGEDMNLILWYTDGQTEPLELSPGSIGGLKAVDFSPNSDQVAAGGCIRTDRIGSCGAGLLTFWELTSGNFSTSTMEVHRGEITALEFDPSGQRVATGGTDGVVYIWNVPPTNSGAWSAKPLFAFSGQVGIVRSLAFSPNGRILVTASDSTILTVRNLQTGEIPAFPLQKTIVNAIAFTPDGRFIATGGEDGNVYIYDMNRLVQVGEPLSGHTYAITGLDFSPDGTMLVSSSEDGTVIQWDLSELKNARLTTAPASQVLQGHNDAVLAVAFGPNGSNLVSGGRDSAVIQWQIPAPYPLATRFINSTDPVAGLGFTEDLVVNRSNGIITSWDLTTGLLSNGDQWVQTDDEVRYSQKISHVFIQPDGQLVGLQNNRIQTGEVRGVDVSQNEGDVDWARVKGAGFQFAFSAATSGIDPVDPLFEKNWTGIRDAGLIRGAYHVFTLQDDPMKQAAFFTETVSWEPGDLPPVVVVQDTQDKGATDFLPRLQEFLVELEALTGRKPILYTSPIYWQSLTGETSASQQVIIPVTGGGSYLTFNASEYPLWVANYTNASQPSLPTGWGTWTFWQYTDQGNAVDEQGNLIADTQVPGIQGNVYLNRFNGTLQALQSLASGESPVAADPGAESTVLVNLETGETIGASLPLLNVTSAALHPDGNLLAVGNENGAITFWDLTKGSQTDRVLVYSNIPILSLAFGPQGNLLAAGSADGNVVIWDDKAGSSAPIILTGHTSRVTSLAYGGNGTVLVSGSANGNVILWDLETHEMVGQPFSGPNASVSALAVNKPETYLAAGFADGMVLIWDIDPASWNNKACRRAGRNMTQPEWEKYLTDTAYQATCP